MDEEFQKSQNWEWDLDKDNRMNLNGSGFFSNETAEMKALRKAYEKSSGKYDKNAYYLFVMESALFDTEPDSELVGGGDMPRGKQFGYLFMQGVDSYRLGRLAAHELGHGIFTLAHTFDVNYAGGEGKLKSENLMSYGGGTELAAFQWNVMANPAPLTWFDSEEDGMMITYGLGMNETFILNFKNTVKLLLNNNTGGIFDAVYSSISQSPQIFEVNTYQLKELIYIDPLTRGYFRAGQQVTLETRWLDKVIANVFGKDVKPRIIEAGSVGAPHHIRFAPPDKRGEKNIETTTKSPSTVFEELFHAAQYLYYTVDTSLVLKEAEVKIARGYIIYLNGGLSGKGFIEWVNDDYWGRKVLSTDAGGSYYYKGIIGYFEAIKNGQSITKEIRDNYRKDVIDYIKTHVAPEYNHGGTRFPENDINSFNGETPYLQALIEKR